MNKKQKSLTNKGFSLVELIIVIAIMAVLVGVLAPQYLKYVENSRAQKDASAADELTHAVEIAITNESIYNSLGLSDTKDTVTVVAADNTDFTCAASSDLVTELKTVIPAGKIDFTSSTYGGKTYTVTIKYDKTAKTVSVKGAFN